MSIVLLTGTIKPFVEVERSDIEARERDYAEALKQWADLGEPVVFCENSGYPSDTIEAIASSCSNVEFLQYQKDYPAHLGKGYAESGTLRYIVENSEKYQQHTGQVIKATGRFYVENTGTSFPRPVKGWFMRT